jgi:hypothetical protein
MSFEIVGEVPHADLSWSDVSTYFDGLSRADQAALTVTLTADTSGESFSPEWTPLFSAQSEHAELHRGNLSIPAVLLQENLDAYIAVYGSRVAALRRQTIMLRPSTNQPFLHVDWDKPGYSLSVSTGCGVRAVGLAVTDVSKSDIAESEHKEIIEKKYVEVLDETENAIVGYQLESGLVIPAVQIPKGKIGLVKINQYHASPRLENQKYRVSLSSYGIVSPIELL